MRGEESDEDVDSAVAKPPRESSLRCAVRPQLKSYNSRVLGRREQNALRLIIALLAVLSLAGLLTLWFRARAAAGIDFYQMWVGARVAGQTTDFYAPSTAARIGEEYVRRAETEERSVKRVVVARYRRQLELVSTPFLYTLYAPFRGTYERGLLLFQLGSLLSLIAAIAILTRTFRFGIVLGLSFLAVLATLYEPAATDLRVANANHFVLLLLAVATALTMRRKMTAAGAVLAVAALAKPYLVLVLALSYGIWLITRRWRDLGAHAGGAAIAGVLGFVASSLYFRSTTIWLEWLHAIRTMPQSMVPLELGNFALTQILFDLWGVRLSIAVTVLALTLAVAIGARAKGVAANIDILAIGLGSVIGLLGSPLVWVHYLVMALPLLAWLLRPARAERMRVAAAVALLLLALAPSDYVTTTPMLAALLVNGGLVLAFAAGLFDLATLEPA